MEPTKSTQHRMSRRRFMAGAGCALGGLALAGCAGLGSEDQQAGGAGTSGTPVAGLSNRDVEGKTNITVWYWDESLKYVTEQFNKTNKNINAKFVKLGYDDVHQKLLTSLPAGSGAPDVCAIEIGFIGAFSARGGLENLLEAPYDAAQFKDKVVTYPWEEASSEDGRLAAMPWGIGPAGLWYREDIFKAAGLETDPQKVQQRIKTWNDWLQLGEDLRKKNAKTALVADAFNDIFWPMVYQKGYGWFDGNRVVVQEKAVPALKKAVEARKRKIDANIDWWGPEWAQGLKQNAFAGMGTASWMQSGLLQQHPQTVGKWRVIRAPEGDFNWGGDFMAIPQQGKNKDAAWEFVKYVCCTAEGQNARLKPTGIFPAFTPAYKDPVYDQGIDFFGGQKVYRLWAEVAENVPGNPVHPSDRQASDIVGNEITKVEKNGKDPAQAMKDAEATILKQIEGVTG